MALGYWPIDEEDLTIRIPAGGEKEASRFYGEVLGMARGPDAAGVEPGGIQLRFDIEVPFRPVPELAAMVVSDLEALLARLADHGIAVRQGEQLEFFERVVVQDPFGNGLALLAER